MKKFLKENWFKLVIALACLVAGLSFFYYFVIYIPYKEAQELKLKQANELQAKLEKSKEDCQKLCDKRAEEDKEYWGKDMIFESACKYVTVSEICYFSGGGRSIMQNNYWQRYIKNAETNQKLFITWNNDLVKYDQKQIDNITEFWNEHKKIFSF